MTGVSKYIFLFLFPLWAAQAQYTPNWVSDEDGRVQWDHNCEFVGESSNLGRKSAKTRNECAGLCFELSSCSRFTWTKVSGACQLSGGTERASYAENGGVCGYVTTNNFKYRIFWGFFGDDVRWAYNCDFYGTTMDVRKVQSVNCGLECFQTTGCIGFTWTRYQGGTCFLKSRGHPMLSYIHTICGGIMNRRASYASSNRSKRKSVLACDEYKEIESHYRSARSDPLLRMEFPWMAAVGYKLNYDFIFRCGGTIISEFYILVSAHCVDVHPAPDVVRLGTHIVNGVKKHEMDLDIESITKHEHFTLETHKNDIALIKLKLPITFSDRIIPACLRAKSNDLPRSQELFVSGWEITKEGKLSNILKKERLRTVELQTCQAEYLKNSSKPAIQISESQYCVFDPDRLDEPCPCPGTLSGGSIHTFEKWQSLATVVGIPSFRKSLELPDVYTRVAFFLEWIEDKVWPD